MGRTFPAQLRQARLAKKWSQRDLSDRAGVPQAHISRIESGAVDPKVSTLQDLARSLDLELTLVPRAALTAVDTIVRETAGETDRRRLRETIQNMHRAAETLQSMAGGLNDRVGAAADDLAKFEPAAVPPWVRADVAAAAGAVDVAIAAHSANALEQATATLSKLLADAQAIAAPSDARPAYILDDED